MSLANISKRLKEYKRGIQAKRAARLRGPEDEPDGAPRSRETPFYLQDSVCNLLAQRTPTLLSHSGGARLSAQLLANGIPNLNYPYVMVGVDHHTERVGLWKHGNEILLSCQRYLLSRFLSKISCHLHGEEASGHVRCREFFYESFGDEIYLPVGDTYTQSLYSEFVKIEILTLPWVEAFNAEPFCSVLRSLVRHHLAECPPPLQNLFAKNNDGQPLEDPKLAWNAYFFQPALERAKLSAQDLISLLRFTLDVALLTLTNHIKDYTAGFAFIWGMALSKSGTLTENAWSKRYNTMIQTFPLMTQLEVSKEEIQQIAQYIDRFSREGGDIEFLINDYTTFAAKAYAGDPVLIALGNQISFKHMTIPMVIAKVLQAYPNIGWANILNDNPVLLSEFNAYMGFIELLRTDKNLGFKVGGAAAMFPNLGYMCCKICQSIMGDTSLGSYRGVGGQQNTVSIPLRNSIDQFVMRLPSHLQSVQIRAPTAREKSKTDVIFEESYKKMKALLTDLTKPDTEATDEPDEAQPATFKFFDADYMPSDTDDSGDDGGDSPGHPGGTISTRQRPRQRAIMDRPTSTDGTSSRGDRKRKREQPWGEEDSQHPREIDEPDLPLPLSPTPGSSSKGAKYKKSSKAKSTPTPMLVEQPGPSSDSTTSILSIPPPVTSSTLKPPTSKPPMIPVEAMDTSTLTEITESSIHPPPSQTPKIPSSSSSHPAKSSKASSADRIRAFVNEKSSMLYPGPAVTAHSNNWNLLTQYLHCEVKVFDVAYDVRSRVEGIIPASRQLKMLFVGDFKKGTSEYTTARFVYNLHPTETRFISQPPPDPPNAIPYTVNLPLDVILKNCPSFLSFFELSTLVLYSLYRIVLAEPGDSTVTGLTTSLEQLVGINKNPEQSAEIQTDRLSNYTRDLSTIMTESFVREKFCSEGRTTLHASVIILFV